MQQDHFTALAGVAEVVAFTSDVVSHVTVLDPAGTERTSGKAIYAVGVPSLLERVPKLFAATSTRPGSGPSPRPPARATARARTSKGCPPQ